MASALEREMEELMAGAGGLAVDAGNEKKKAGKARRKSKDLEDQLGEAMEKLSSSEAATASAAGRIRRQSRDHTDDELRAAFDKHASDGKLPSAKLAEAIKDLDAQCTDEIVKEMCQAAGDSDALDFEEFKTVIVYKTER
jgi:Ca2+-binding EF-hand superfamily protein